MGKAAEPVDDTAVRFGPFQQVRVARGAVELDRQCLVGGVLAVLQRLSAVLSYDNPLVPKRFHAVRESASHGVQRVSARSLALEVRQLARTAVRGCLTTDALVTSERWAALVSLVEGVEILHGFEQLQLERYGHRA